MYLKLLEGDGGYTVIEVSQVAIRRLPEPRVIYVNGDKEEKEVKLTGDAFILNHDGITIDAFFLRGRR